MTATARPTARVLVLVVVAALLGALLTVATRTNPAAAAKPKQPVLLFVADGMRQDIVARYAAEKNGVPTLARMLKDGASATDGGMRTQAPPNTGSGWFTIATGAWPGVHGSTNNTFHVNGQPFGNSTSALGSPNVLQAESIAQSAERAGKKVAQIEYAGGRASAISGPTVDFRNFLSGRGVVTNYISPSDDAPFVQAFNLQFDHPAGFSNQPPFPAATPVAGNRVDRRAEQLQPRDGNAHAGDRLWYRQIRTERIHLRLHRRQHDQLRPRALLAHQERCRRRCRPRARASGPT